MADIYLSYSEPNLALAQDLKKDVESCSTLQVKLEDHDWEERDDCDFCGNINKAKMFILIATEHSNITAWVIDHDATKRRRSIMQPPTLDFSSYDQGMIMLKYVLRMVTGARRFHKRASERQSSSSTLLKKDQKPTMPQRQRSAPRHQNDESNIHMPAMPQRQESLAEEPKQESSFANANQLPKPTPRRRSSTLTVIMENYQRIMNRVQSTLDASTSSTTDL